MKLEIFAIRDNATGMYGTPMFLTTKGQAIRGFSDEVNRQDKDNMLNKHPEDFEMHHLGSFETDTGVINAITPKQVMTAKEVTAPKQ